VYLDKQQMFSEEQEVTTVQANDSTNFIAFGTPYMGETAGGSDGEFFCRVVEDVAGTSSTVQIKLLTDSTSTFASATTLYDSGAIAEANLTANTEICRIRLPHGIENWCKVTYTIGNNVLSAGTFDAGIILDRQTGEGPTTYP